MANRLSESLIIPYLRVCFASICLCRNSSASLLLLSCILSHGLLVSSDFSSTTGARGNGSPSIRAYSLVTRQEHSYPTFVSTVYISLPSSSFSPVTSPTKKKFLLPFHLHTPSLS